MKNLRTYDVPIQHIRGAIIRWHMNVWESPVLDRGKLKKEFNYTDEQITALWRRSRQDTKPAQRLIDTKLYKTRKMAMRWFRRYTADSLALTDT